MKLLDSKRALEQFFLDGYSETPIHWAGTKFDRTNVDEWISFSYVAEVISDCGFDNTEYSQRGTIQISVLAKTQFRCYQISDVIFEMFKGTKIEALFAGKVTIIGQDYLSDLDRSVIEFDIEMKTL